MKIYITEDHYDHTPYGCPLDFWIARHVGDYPVQAIITNGTKRVAVFERMLRCTTPATLIVVTREHDGVWLRGYVLSSDFTTIIDFKVPVDPVQAEASRKVRVR